MYIKKVTCVSVMALSSVVVHLGPLSGEILKHTVLLSPNSCIFQFSTLKCKAFHLPFFGIEIICWSTGPSTVKTLYIVQTLKTLHIVKHQKVQLQC